MTRKMERKPSMFARMTTAVEVLARATALLGGIVLIALVISTCLSIIGRTLVPIGLRPIKGDFEIIEIGVGFAVFAFLPWCHFNRGHASVDLLKPVFPPAFNRAVDLLADLAMLVAASLIAWRLALGMLDKLRYGETTFILRFPVWIAYAAGLFGATVFVVVAAYCCVRSLRTLGGHPEDEGRDVEP